MESGLEAEEEFYEDIKESIRSFLVEKVNEAYTRHISKLMVEVEGNQVTTPAKEDVSFQQRLQVVLDAGLLPWAMRRGEEVLFTVGLAEELREVVGKMEYLKSIAELLGWDYTVVKIGKRSTRATRTTLEDLIDFLAPSTTHSRSPRTTHYSPHHLSSLLP
jgi:hypothetical protein